MDDRSRYCVIAVVVPRATGRAVCLAFAAALARFAHDDCKHERHRLGGDYNLGWRY